MNVTEAAAVLLTNFSPEERSIPDHATYPGRNSDVRAAMNGALQELFGDASPWVRSDETGAVLQPPAVNVEIEVTNGSKAAIIAEDSWKPWFPGCSIAINGSAVDNEIRNDVRNAVLRFPHDGATGTTTAIVYHNSVTLGTDVLSITGKVRADGLPIGPLPTADLRTDHSEEDYGFHRQLSPNTQQTRRISEWLGKPLSWHIETWSPSAVLSPVQRIRLAPAPATQTVLEYSVRLGPPVITNLASTDQLPIPFQFIELLFLPLARKHLLTSQFFRNTGAESQINAGYVKAIALLKSLNPKKRTGRRIRPA